MQSISVLILALLPCLALADNVTLSEETRHDLTISGSSVGGDIIIDGSTGQNVHVDNSQVKGSLFFVNGCAVYNNMIHECDGTQHQMNAMQRTRLRKRIAQIKRAQRAQKGGKSKKNNKRKGKPVNKKNKKNPRKAAGKKSRKQAGRRNRMKKHGRRMRGAHLPGKWSPCNTCKGEDEGEGGPDGEDEGKEGHEGEDEGKGGFEGEDENKGGFN
ncbi:hypothetical protein M3Y98_00050800 [Aphelenchoides besseyi]|nr:hypothetical protein M3Y98_00050800 [Aphelenchoides besseyi]KAI6198940.1 hypothetical protein M3Y96_00573800 [Aphelenchoides besseyi]